MTTQTVNQPTSQDLREKLLQLDAMLQNTHGESAAGFAFMTEDQRAWYLMSCQRLVGEALGDLDSLMADPSRFGSV